nr:hypothetical protein [Thermosipho melanesiensis]
MRKPILIVTPGSINGIEESILNIELKNLLVFVLAIIYAPGSPSRRVKKDDKNA